jgi:hypothetical protein
MTGQNSDRNILVPALEAALAHWEEWKREKTILGSYPPPDAVLVPLAAAIAKCDVYKPVAGRSLFSGYSGVVLHASSLALPLLYHADRPNLGPSAVSAAADWLIRTLGTRKADGVFIVVIWGLSVDREVNIADRMTLVPFYQLSDSYMKRRIAERAEFTKQSRRAWDQGVWSSPNLYDLPGAAIVRKVAKFPYIGSPAASFGRLAELQAETKLPLPFLEASAAGQPLVTGSWFEYEDRDLDFNEHENYLALSTPEIVPHVRSHVSAEAMLGRACSAPTSAASFGRRTQFGLIPATGRGSSPWLRATRSASFRPPSLASSCCSTETRSRNTCSLAFSRPNRMTDSRC